MRSRKCLLVLATLMFVAAEPSRAQQSVPSGKSSADSAAPASDSGLLLGLYISVSMSWDDARRGSVRGEEFWTPEISGPTPHGKYVTFWISRIGSVIEIRAVDGILVPRADGFWHVGTEFVKAAEQDSTNFEERMWVLPAGQKHEPTQIDKGLDSLGFSQTNLLITYIGSRYISYLENDLSGVGNWHYVYPRVVSLDDLQTQLTPDQVLGLAAGKDYRLTAKQMDHMSDVCKEGQDCEPCLCCTGDPKEWGIREVNGAWEIYARFHEGTSSDCSQGSEDKVLKVQIPKSLVANGSSGKPWESLVSDAAFDPEGRPRDSSPRFRLASPGFCRSRHR